ncbi:unnamed protein product [Acanthoscelides obtectus]|uniref:Ig-like domain-containing protein n=1 Tax=Acanthoscelides obtectus TaxID=200917 RepID=A0A9P0VP16_ACAOB|nr:unnamed protein product [Acanthoscelides obtectus]
MDARFGPVGKATHFANTDNLGTRTHFITEDEPSKARLRIERVTEQDQGVFRCRVDFVNSPTRNFRVNLTLVVQPSAPKIFDAEGHPKPSVTWWNNGTMLDGVIDSDKSSYITVNQLEIRSTPRNFKSAHLECRASSSELAGFVSRVVPLIVYRKLNYLTASKPVSGRSNRF